MLNGAEKAGQVNGASYTLPMVAIICTPDYRVGNLGANQGKGRASRLLIDYLTAPAQQTDNARTNGECAYIAHMVSDPAIGQRRTGRMPKQRPGRQVADRRATGSGPCED